MKKVLLTTTLCLASAAAQAQVVTYDPANFAKNLLTAAQTGQQVVNSAKQVAAEIHGNGFGIGSLVPTLSSALTSNPLGSIGQNASSMMSGTGGRGLGGLFSRFLGQTQTYQPSGNDPEAQMLTQRASAAAGQMAVAQQFLNSSSSRLSLLPQLVNSLTGTADMKDAVDANTRVNSEQMTQGAQSAQLQAMQIYQVAEANAQRSREELAWRKGADTLSAQTQRALANANSGQINLVTE